MSEQLKLCPFCGGLPYFSKVSEVDDCMFMELTCCTTMSKSVGWGKYRNMSEEEIHAHLKAQLVAEWNTRYASEELAATKLKLAECG